MTDSTYINIITKIAEDIEKLKSEYPQLQDFQISKNLNTENLSIDYSFKTYRRRIGGWVGGVPNPHEDGVWFYIDIHSPDSQAQIHTQPDVPYNLYVEEKQVQFLILEGQKTKSLYHELFKIFEKNGIKNNFKIGDSNE